MARESSELRRRLQQWFTDDGLVREPTDDELRRFFETEDFDEIEVDESGLPRLVEFVKQQLEEQTGAIEVGETRVPLPLFLRFFLSPDFVPIAGSETLDRESARRRVAQARTAISRAIEERLREEERIVLETWLTGLREDAAQLDDELIQAAESVLGKLKSAITDTCGPIGEVVRAADSCLNE